MTLVPASHAFCPLTHTIQQISVTNFPGRSEAVVRLSDGVFGGQGQEFALPVLFALGAHVRTFLAFVSVCLFVLPLFAFVTLFISRLV
jgi:hypothetical protein